MEEFRADKIKYRLLCLAKLLLCLVECLTDVIFGYTYSGGTKAEREAAKLYSNSEHMVK